MPDYFSIGHKTVGTSGRSIQDVINHIGKTGVQRANRYSVGFINCPVTPQQNTATQFEFIATLCQLPERSIQYFQDSVGPYSPSWDIPLKTKFDDNYIITFLVDGSWAIRSLIESWMDFISGRVFNGGYVLGTSSLDARMQGTNQSGQTAEIVIKGFKTADNSEAATLRLYGVWPKIILPYNMDTNAMNMPLTMSVVFGYRYYRFE